MEDVIEKENNKQNEKMDVKKNKIEQSNVKRIGINNKQMCALFKT